ncbi:MAG: tetratricopeptide repeat protein [Lachnospiraceae bacterium]|nr:tetratricopeptide repeat protein [Lachnospiraceae bacterium]
MKKTFGLFCVFVLMVALVACGSASGSGMTWQEQYDLGMQYLTDGDYEAAIVAFTAAIEIDGKDIQAYSGLVQAYIGTGDYESAAATAEQGAEVFEESAQAQANGAVDEFTATLLTLGELCLEKEECETAEAIYTLLIGIDENLVDAYVGRAEMYLLLGEREKALEDYRKALELLQQGEAGNITEEEIKKLIDELDSTDASLSSVGTDKNKKYLLEEKYIVVDGVSTLLQRYTYNDVGGVLTYYECDTDSLYSMYETYTYDEYGCLLTSDAEHYREGSVTYQETKTYNDGKLMINEYKYLTDDFIGYNIEYAYDESGNLIKETWLMNSGSTQILEYRYENGLLVEICTVAGYSNASIIYYTYDDKGNLLSQLDVGENDSSHVLMEYTYDENGNVLTESESMDIGKDYLTKDWEYVYVYDEDGKLIEKYVYTFYYSEPGEEEVNSTTITEYTYEDGKLLKEVEYSYRADGTLYDNGVHYTEYEYDANGNLIESVYLDSEYTELYKYVYTYEAIVAAS